MDLVYHKMNVAREISATPDAAERARLFELYRVYNQLDWFESQPGFYAPFLGVFGIFATCWLYFQVLGLEVDDGLTLNSFFIPLSAVIVGWGLGYLFFLNLLKRIHRLRSNKHLVQLETLLSRADYRRSFETLTQLDPKILKHLILQEV